MLREAHWGLEGRGDGTAVTGVWIHTARLQDRLCRWAKPGAHADGVGQSRETSQAVPERGTEDVGVEGL